MNELAELSNEAIATQKSTLALVDVEGASAFMENYQEVCKALLDKSDYQNVIIKGKPHPFKKKSAWRKIATAFNITDEIIEKEIIRDDNYQIISATFYVKATAPNGRSGVASASCAIFDKINSKDKEQPSNFELRKRFNNAENDVITTAHTRAKSRAISDLVGMGEVSAEELGDMGVIEKPKSVNVTPKKSAKPTLKTTPKKKTIKSKQPVSEVEKNSEVQDEEVIEVEVIAPNKKSKSLKDLMKEDNSLKMCINELREENAIVNRKSVRERLLLKHKSGVLSKEAYEKALEIME